MLFFFFAAFGQHTEPSHVFGNFYLYPASGRSLQISPGKNDNLPLVTATSTAQGPGSIGLSLGWQSRPPLYGLICGFCPSAREFALRWTFQPPQSGFLQIPPRDGHPCLRLTVPATESVVDFHHQVVAHAGRTNERRRLERDDAFFLCFFQPQISDSKTSIIHFRSEFFNLKIQNTFRVLGGGFNLIFQLPVFFFLSVNQF